MRSIKVFIISLITLPLLLWSCSKTTQSGFNQTYQNITARYNRYYNANATYVQAIKSLKKTKQEDYTKLLSVYDYGDPEDAAAYSGDFQTVMDKATTAIVRKDTNRAELSRWADDAYLLIGKSEYLQGDYAASSETFRYIVGNFEKGFKSELMEESKYKKKYKKYKPKKYQKRQEKKKEEVEKELSYGLFSHIPSRNEGLIWLSKSLVKEGEYEDAANILAFAETDKLFPTNFDKELVKANVFYQMEQGNLDIAVGPLTELIDLTRKKREKARYYYILGQIHLEKERYGEAFDNFNLVLKNNPSFDLQFYAKLQIAIAAYRSNTKPAKLKKTLMALTRDTKNEDKMGLVYYALGVLELADNDKAEGEEFLLKSLNYEFGNTNYKAEAYRNLAELYYDQESFRLASNYYDSTLVEVDKTHPDIDEIEDRKIALNRLVKQMDIIALTDSLLEISRLDEKALNKYLDNEIAKLEEEKAQELDPNIQPEKVEGGQVKENSVAFAGAGKFYWNNQSSIDKGYQEFLRIWGERPLEDDWRRKDKATAISFDDALTDTGESESLVDLTDYDAERQAILQRIPLSDEAKTKSEEAIVEAYYTMALVYKNDLNNLPKTVETLEALLARYSTNRYQLEAYYTLYLTYDKLGDQKNSQKYKSMLVTKFPNSKFAKAITDPNFIEKSQAEKEKLHTYYEKTFEYYQKGSYNVVLSRSDEAGKLFASAELDPKFDLLSAMSLGGMRRFKDYETALKGVINDHPEDEVADKAKELLAVLNPEALVNVGSSGGPPKPMPIDTQSIEVPKEEGVKEDPEIEEPIVDEEVKEPLEEVVEEPVEESVIEELDAEEEPTKDTAVAPDVLEDEPVEEEEPLVEEGPKLPEDTIDLNTLPYGMSENSPHQFAVLIVDRSISSKEVKEKLNAFVTDSSRAMDLSVSSTYLNLSTKVVNVKPFSNQKQAMNFYDLIIAKDGPLSDYKQEQIRVVVISSLNYSLLLANKDVYGYSKFFRVNYLEE